MPRDGKCHSKRHTKHPLMHIKVYVKAISITKEKIKSVQSKLLQEESTWIYNYINMTACKLMQHLISKKLKPHSKNCDSSKIPIPVIQRGPQNSKR